MATPLQRILAILVATVVMTACSSDETPATTPGSDAATAPDGSSTTDGTAVADTAASADISPTPDTVADLGIDGAGPDVPVPTGCTSDSDCDDDVSCTLDTCGAAGTCENTLAPGNCQIDGVCVAEGATRPDVPCFSCQAAVSTTAWSEVGGACEDGVSCTDDRCDAVLGCVNEAADANCDDGFACTTDVCDATTGCTHVLDPDTCLIDGACLAVNDKNPASACGSCKPSVATDTWSELTNGCHDELLCTDDLCDPVNGCTHTIQAGFCLIDGACVAEGEQNPDNECLTCQPTVSATDWSPRTGSCDDGEDCTYEDACDAGACGGIVYSCDDGLDCTEDICWGNGLCANNAMDGFCEIDGVCFASGDINPDNECQACNSDSQQYIWASVGSDVTCTDDGLACTKDVCSGGSCVHVLEDNIVACFIDGACYGGGETNPEDSCQWCEPSVVTYDWTEKPAGSVCEDCRKCGGAKNDCMPAADLDLTGCDDTDASTMGDMCRDGVCSGFSVTMTDHGTSQEGYTHAKEASEGGVHALYKDCSGLCYHRAEYFDGTSTSTIDDQLGIAVDYPGFGDGVYTSLDTMWVYTATGWSSTAGVAAVFNGAAPNANWHLANRRDNEGSGLVVVDAVGWLPGGGSVVYRCTFSLLCPTCPWQCEEVTVSPADSGVDMRQCVGVVDDGIGGGGFAKSSLYCNNADAFGTPSEVQYWSWQGGLERWATFFGTTYGVTPGQRLLDVAGFDNLNKVMVGTDGLFRLDSVPNFGPLSVTALGADQADTDFKAIARWGGFTIVLAVTTKDVGGGMETFEVSLLSNDGLDGDLSDGDQWVLTPVTSYTCPTAGPCPYDVAAMAAHASGIYLFGAWSPDGVERDRAVWHWTAP